MGVEDMPDVKQRMIDIVNSVPDDYFDGLKPTEMVFKLMVEYIKRYGEDETTIIPGTDKHFNYENLKEIFENKNLNYKEAKQMEFLKKSLNKVNVQENTLYDIIYDLFFYAKLQESEEDIKNGRICTLEELRQHINELEEKHANNNIG